MSSYYLEHDPHNSQSGISLSYARFAIHSLKCLQSRKKAIRPDYHIVAIGVRPPFKRLKYLNLCAGILDSSSYQSQGLTNP